MSHSPTEATTTHAARTETTHAAATEHHETAPAGPSLAGTGPAAPPHAPTGSAGLATTDVPPGDRRMSAQVRPLIRALRPALTDAGFDRFAAEAHAQGLVFTAVHDEHGHCLAVATHRVLATSRGRILFVDDLVTDPARRSGGVGALLLAHLTERARAAHCDRVELDSGVTNHAAHRFYHARRMGIAALHFALDVSGGVTGE
ncbi:GNAT family N-acetyltransferase [Streptomyces sp. NPDC049954]|uniref:GNAT family N-acetyltransferase n=1 Tax=Streptomyces sp. NPDC049954 TaxID=3155779 RepID=UPI003432193E